MSKRKVKDPVTKFVGDLVRTPTAQSGTGRVPNSQTYYKENYLDAVKIVTPNLYFDDDIALSGSEVPAASQLINSHILAADSSGVIFVSSLSTIDYLSSVSGIGGLAKFFVKQNNLSWLTPTKFEDDILFKLGKSFDDFSSSAEFLNYISGTFLPTIVLQKENGSASNDLADNTASAFDNTSSGTHKFLIDNLSWLYFLNTTDPAGANVRPTNYATSSEVAKLITEKLWNGDPISLNEQLKVFQKYLWSNYSNLSSINEKILPEKYRVSSVGTWTSGTQHRDRLDTLVDVVYSPNYFDVTDRKVKDSFTSYIGTEALIDDEESAGPFNRAMKAFSYSFADRSGEANEIATLIDIDSCPDEFLPYLADLIGWTLIGPDVARHRNQLRQAMAVYKAKGTKRSVQAMVDTVFGSPSAFNVTSGTLFDLWESYIPNLMFYAIATSSTLTQDGLESFTREKANNLGLDKYSDTDLDKNVRLAVDRIMWELANEHPNNFIFGDKVFPRVKFVLDRDRDQEYTGPWSRDENGDYFTGETPTITSLKLIPLQDPNFVFKYRDRVMPIPPWEEIKYYSNCLISLSLLDAIKKKLICFGVDSNSANEIYSYIKTNTISNEDVSFYRNSFLFFNRNEQLPFNYDDMVNVKRPQGNELLKYLPYWNSKSSYFKIVQSASSFDFTSRALDKNSKYALSRIKTLVNTVAPAHSIPDIILDVSAVEDTNINFTVSSTQKVDMGLSSIAASGSSATVLTNFAVSAVNPRNTSVLPASLQTVFRREDADALNDGLFSSGVADVFFSSAPRNAIRRKNYKYLLDYENVHLRQGIGAAGFDWLYRASQYPTTTPVVYIASGEFSLGYIPSSLSFKEVALKRDPNNFGNLIDTVNLHPVWNSCQAYNSSDVFFEINVSNTFPVRGLSAVDSSSVSSFFSRRGSLDDLQILQHKVEEESIYQEASSIVSGLYMSDGSLNPDWATSSNKLTPTTLSSWYVDSSKDVVRSIANQLSENTISVTNTNYMRDFSFGQTLMRLYKDWLTNYGRPSINFNYKYSGANNIISHTYGPYIFNHDFDITASAIETAPSLVASTLDSQINIGYGQGYGVLSPSNSFGITTESVTASDSMYVWWPEVRNDTLLSGVEFVDTSNPYQALGYGQPTMAIPTTFSLIRLTDKQQFLDTNTKKPVWSRASKLQDNLVIKYSRPQVNAFPRLRYKIEPDSSRPDIKNFLMPDCEYSIDINAANLDGDSVLAGGSTLKVWVHTEPIDFKRKLPNGSYTTEKSVWSYVNGQWVRQKLSDLTTDTSFYTTTSNGIGKRFTERNITALTRSPGAESSTQRSIVDNTFISPYEDLNPRIGCIEGSEETVAEQIMGSPEIFETLSFNFDTKNSNTEDQILSKVHTNSRKYYIEIFLAEADESKFVIFDTISMHNKTFKEKAHVPTEYNKYELNKKELKTCFDYFTSLANSRLASRNAVTTSGNMEVSGGGRLSYRDNIKREIYEGVVAPYYQVSSLIIRGN